MTSHAKTLHRGRFKDYSRIIFLRSLNYCSMTRSADKNIANFATFWGVVGWHYMLLLWRHGIEGWRHMLQTVTRRMTCVWRGRVAILCASTRTSRWRSSSWSIPSSTSPRTTSTLTVSRALHQSDTNQTQTMMHWKRRNCNKNAIARQFLINTAYFAISDKFAAR